MRRDGLCTWCGQGEPLPVYAHDAAHALCEMCYIKKAARTNFGTCKHWAYLKAKLEAQQRRCPHTGTTLTLGVNDSIDHIYPISRFPELRVDPDNAEWVCREVNEMKRDRTPDEFLTLLKHIIAHTDRCQVITTPMGVVA